MKWGVRRQHNQEQGKQATKDIEPELGPLWLLPQDQFGPVHWRTLRGYFANRELANWNGARALWLPMFLFKPMMSQKAGQSRSFGVMKGKQMIGTAELYDLSPHKQSATLGIMLAPEHCGQGHGRKAVGLLLAIAFEQGALQTVGLSTFGHNLRAQRAFAASGFREVSRHQSREREDVHMEISREEYLRLRGGGEAS